jgi:hypothetical protein
MFKVCAAARDNSNLCFGTVSDFATPRGWFGEQQCILIDVLRLLVKWGGDFVNLGSDPWTVKAYVGCEFKFHLTVSDALVDPNNAGDVPYALEAMLQDTGLPHVTTTAHSGTSGIGIPQRLAAATLDAVWVPRRRTEGKIFRMCFAARDLAGVLSTPTDLVCRGGILIISRVIFLLAMSSNFFAIKAWCLPWIKPGHIILTNSIKFICAFSLVNESL